MRRTTGPKRALVDAFSQQVADLTASFGDDETQRLRSAMASAMRSQLRPNAAIQPDLPVGARLRPVVDDEFRAALTADLDTVDRSEGEAFAALSGEPLLITRRDIRETLLSGSLLDSLTALRSGERLGPFGTQGGIGVWFDIYFAARRMQVRETGSPAPAIVFTQARLPVLRRATTIIDIEPGTVWVRGDLLPVALPANAYVGFKVRGGSLKLRTAATITDDLVEIAAPLQGDMTVELAADVVVPAAGACTSAAADVSLPGTLKLSFDGGTTITTGASGRAEAWGQTFDFGECTGSWSFIERLWTAVLSYDVEPGSFDAANIGDDLAHFEGVGAIGAAGLGLPVAVAPNFAILGETALAAAWFMEVTGLTARWYDRDPRPHPLGTVWVGISDFGGMISAGAVAPLVPSVAHDYALWNIREGGENRLPWRQRYAAAFPLFYRCHAVEGETLLVLGRADFALDRPVTTDGVPVLTKTTTGAVLLSRFAGVTTASLGAIVEDPKGRNQFALRNALVWTGAPLFLFAQGTLTAAREIDAGGLQFLFGVFAWAPTLPDPYVANASVTRPRLERAEPKGVLLCRVTWDAPDRVSVSFEGQLGAQLALGGRPASTGPPRPARGKGSSPDVGLTLVEQDHRAFHPKAAHDWAADQSREMGERDQRAADAMRRNRSSLAAVDNFMTEAAGPAANVLLLDVSTNQDLLGVAVGGPGRRDLVRGSGGIAGPFQVEGLAVHSPMTALRVVALPQVQWEPVRTLDADQDILTMGWFPTPLASANDGGATQIGVRSQKLKAVIPNEALAGTVEAFREGIPVGVRTTFPFGLISAVRLQPLDEPDRKADRYGLTRPRFPEAQSRGGIQITAHAEGGRPADGGVSPAFQGQMRQLLNGVELATGSPLGLSVLGETLQPAGSVERVFNNNMAANPRVPVTRIDLSGYGGSNFSDWQNPFAAFADTAKVQFQVMVGRTALEVIKVNSVLHPWGIRVTRSVTIERRPGGGVIRRDSGWQAFTPGIFDYRYADEATKLIVVADYAFDAGVFRGLFEVRDIRPAPGTVFSHGTAELVPYYFDAELELEGVPGRTAANGVLGWLQIEPSGEPAPADALKALIEAQGPIGGPVEAWMDFGESGLPFRVQRIEVGLAMDGPTPVFVATARGVPSLPDTGAWSVVTRPAKNIPANGGEAVPVAEKRGVPVIRRNPVEYFAGDDAAYPEIQLSGTPGDYRLADAADLLTPAAPANDYALLQSTPTHAFLFPRPFVAAAGGPRLQSGHKVALADVFARSTSKGAFPPSANVIELPAGLHHLDVNAAGKLALSAEVKIVNYPTPLRVGGSPGHGTSLFYDDATLRFELDFDRWESEFSGLRFWSDIAGMDKATGTEMRMVGATDQRPEVADVRSLLQEDIEKILQYIAIFGERGSEGPVDLGATNSKRETKVEIALNYQVPPASVVAAYPAGTGIVLKLALKASTGLDLTTGGMKASAGFGADLEGKIPLLSGGVAAVFVVLSGQITFSLASLNGQLTSEKLDLMAFVGLGVEAKFAVVKATAFIGVGFILSYDFVAGLAKYGGIVKLEATLDFVIVKASVRAELKGLVYDAGTETKCDYSGSVKVHVDIFLVFSINVSYAISDTTTL